MKNDDLDRLLKVTSGCRDDMHEPDEQNLRAWVLGDHLDNACGDTISTEALIHGYQELVVVLRRGGEVERFNLASLIALARRAPRRD